MCLNCLTYTCYQCIRADERCEEHEERTANRKRNIDDVGPTVRPRPIKIVKMGEVYEEHIFNRKNETFIGTWVKAGHDVFYDDSARMVMNCESCFEDNKQRERNRTPRQPLRSYKVEGCTPPNDFWWWAYGLCDNKNCWGPYKRTIQFQRQGAKMLLQHFKELNGRKNATECIDKIFCHISESGSGHIYSGVACTVGFGAFFWPLFKDLKEKTPMNIYIQMTPKQMRPENVVELERKDWPPYYKYNPKFIYSHTIEFRIFPTKMVNGAPASINELENIDWPELARVYGFMYPGGAGMRIESYRYIDGPEPRRRIEAPGMPLWWPSAFTGFIKGVQSGWAGPMISFWRRESVNNPFFS